MLRKCNDEDISDEECEKVINPFYENYDSYLEEYVIPEVIAFYIASSFYRNAMWEATFKQHFNNEFPKEQLFFTYEEFKQFLSVETDIKWIGIFEILYYCKLRKGDLKGLTWKDIYFDKKVLSVNKQITQRNNRVKFEFSDTKTRDSRRIVSITKVLLNNLKMLYEQDKKNTMDLMMISLWFLMLTYSWF